jgi:hypothetical protein
MGTKNQGELKSAEIGICPRKTHAHAPIAGDEDIPARHVGKNSRKKTRQFPRKTPARCIRTPQKGRNLREKPKGTIRRNTT